MRGTAFYWVREASITDCSVFNNTGGGLAAEYGAILLVKNGRIFNNGYCGLFLSYTGQCVVDNCYIHHNGGPGIFVVESNKFTVKSNKVFNNVSHGINVLYSEGDIKENDVFDNRDWGIWTEGNLSVTVTMNNVSRNKAGGIRMCGEDRHLFLVNRKNIYNNLGPGFVEDTHFPEEHSHQSQDNEISNNKEIGKLNLSIPFCSNCRKSCELRKCEKCFTSAYCSESCQESHWSKHEKICKVLCEKLTYVVTVMLVSNLLLVYVF